ncbi:hypothetical protein CWT12_06550 [Actinomyces sp. 432]|uniref:hypothetical protein n=1 Tax=Actinomyces sp. 432 TaxID=2057798 RepID=UPI0013741475|nr:hypothetical protein [Actinomyces sp. 432]QHO91048.1 hypothetical protein CWT12_06550 [Actinomyces sp. 432]
MTAAVGSVEWRTAVRILAADYTRELRVRYCGQVWEHYTPICEAAAMDLTDELAREPEWPTPAEVEWATRQLAPNPPTTDPEED